MKRNIISFVLLVMAVAVFAPQAARAEIPGLYIAASGTYIPPGPAYYGGYYGGGIGYGGGYGYGSLPILPYGYGGYYGGFLGLLLSRPPESDAAQEKKEDGKNLQRAGKASKDVVKAYKGCVEFEVHLKLPNPASDCKPILEMARTPIS